MNDENKQSPETSAQEPERKEPAMESAPTKEPKDELASPEQPEKRSDGDARSGDPTLELVKMDSFVEGELPEPSPHVVGTDLAPSREPEQRQEQQQREAMPQGVDRTEKGIRDNSGRYFDPEKHQHRNGIPKTSDKGYFRPSNQNSGRNDNGRTDQNGDRPNSRG